MTAAVLGIGIGALVSGLTAHQYAKDTPAARASWDPTALSGSGMVIAQLAIGVLGIMIITSEYATGAIRTSLAAVPRRGRFLGAKAVTIAGVAFVAAGIITFTAFFVGQALISGRARAASLSQPGVLRSLIGYALYEALIALLGLALGALLRHAAGAIAVLVALVFVLPAIASALPSSMEHTVEKFWPTQAGQQVTVVAGTANELPAWAAFGVLCLFVAIVLAAAFFVTSRRDT
jgi:ABC-2 type transport system permease protein